MNFSFESPLAFPRARVFAVLQHELSALVPLLPNIDRVELVREDTHGDGRPYSLHHWYATPGMAPALIRPFVSKAMTQRLDPMLRNLKHLPDAVSRYLADR